MYLWVLSFNLSCCWFDWLDFNWICLFSRWRQRRVNPRVWKRTRRPVPSWKSRGIRRNSPTESWRTTSSAEASSRRTKTTTTIRTRVLVITANCAISCPLPQSSLLEPLSAFDSTFIHQIPFKREKRETKKNSLSSFICCRTNRESMPVASSGGRRHP